MVGCQHTKPHLSTVQPSHNLKVNILCSYNTNIQSSIAMQLVYSAERVAYLVSSIKIEYQ